ncbi:GIY-YIG nuclease family protein [Vibrio gallicus]|uniref:hypothetical protein n=1 Tax=Vibrio gallicus TaxID=190897 RepID=UPI0021C2F710|nr:hypothetical protein [Vibrio gallicus]
MKTSGKMAAGGTSVQELQNHSEQKALFINAYSASRQPVVYVIASKDQTFLHVASSSNLQTSIWERKVKAEQCQGMAFLVQDLVYFEAVADIRSAQKRVKEILNWPEKEIRELVESLNPNWDDLFHYF